MRLSNENKNPFNFIELVLKYRPFCLFQFSPSRHVTKDLNLLFRPNGEELWNASKCKLPHQDASRRQRLATGRSNWFDRTGRHLFRTYWFEMEAALFCSCRFEWKFKLIKKTHTYTKHYSSYKLWVVRALTLSFVLLEHA